MGGIRNMGRGVWVVESFSGGGAWAEPHGGRSCVGGAMRTGGARAGLARCSCCAAPPSTRSRTRAHGPGHPGGRPPRPAQASRSGAQRAGSGRGRRAATEDPRLGPAEVSVATEVAERRRRGPVGAFVCGARPQSRRLPSLPPSQAGDLCRTPCPGKRDPFAQCQTPCIPAGSERGTQALEGGQTRVALAEPGHDTTASLGHPWSHPRGPCT